MLYLSWFSPKMGELYWILNLFFFFFESHIHLRERDQEQGEGQGEKETKSPLSRKLDKGLPGPWGHDLSWNQVRHLTTWATQDPQNYTESYRFYGKCFFIGDVNWEIFFTNQEIDFIRREIKKKKEVSITVFKICILN